MSVLKCGLIGAGAMGANHARVIAESEGAQLAVVVDRDRRLAQEVASRFGAEARTDLDDVRGLDAVIVATTTASHVGVALPLLAAGIPLLIEKPLAETLDDVAAILDASRTAGAPVMCGFVERFNPAFATARALIDEPAVQVNSLRHSPRNPSASSSVVQDLLIHDIDLALLLAGEPLPEVRGGLWRPKEGSVSEIAECILHFRSGMLANLSASRWGQRKVRELRVTTEHRLVEIDLLRVNVTVYRNVSQSTILGDGRDYRAETIIDVPYVRHRGEPLAIQLAAFVDLVRSDDPDRAEGERQLIEPPHAMASVMERM